MTYNFIAKKATALKKRPLGLESLESRELLSVNPLALGIEAPDQNFVQAPAAQASTSQDFSTEAATGTTVINYTSGATVTSVGATGLTATTGYTLFYQVGTGASTAPTNNTTAWTTAWTNTTKTATSDGSGDITAVDPGTLTGFASGQTVSFTWVETSKISAGTDASWSTIANKAFAASAAEPSNATVSVSGVTTSAATLTWTKPTTFGSGDKVGKVVKYYISINGGADIDLGTKTSYTLTGLAANPTYTITADIQDATTSKGAHKVDIGSSSTTPISLVTAGTAAGVTVGAPTEVKTAYVKATATKPASVKVTWKAPANYTGGYTVTLHNVADGATTTNDITKEILPGAKLEWTITTTDAKPILDATRYSVVVKPTATNSIASTATYVNVGTVPAAGTVADVNAVAGGQLANVPGGTTITITPPSSGVTGIAGYYVGLTTQSTFPTSPSPNISKLVFVPVGTNTVNLIAPDSTLPSYVYAITVADDGSLSAGKISASAITTTTDTGFTTPLPVADYPAASNVSGVTATEQSAKDSYTVTWTDAKDVIPDGAVSTATSVSGETAYFVTGYRVTATIEGGLTVQKDATNGTTGVTFDNLNWGNKCDFKVEALINKVDGTGTDTWDSLKGTANSIAAAVSKVVTIAKAPTVAPPTKVDSPFTSADGLSATVNWKPSATSGVTKYKVEVVDANKAVIGSAEVTGTSVVIGNGATETGLKEFVLTPGAKYTVNVYSVGGEPGALSKALGVAVTATPFVTGTVKDAKATTINSVKLTVAAPTKGAGTGDKYYVEYTNVVDAKGKPDWNAAKVYDGADTGSPVAASGDITISHLAPGSQYYFRVVTVDKVFVSGTTAWNAMEKSVAGKEIKVKTVAVPLATIAKTGYSVTGAPGGELGLKIAGNTMSRVDGLATKQILTSLTGATYTYTLLISTDSKVDKATGKLNGAVTALTPVTVTTANTSATDKKVTDLSGEVGFTAIFTALGITSGNFTGVKGLSVQLEVEVKYNSNADTFTSYSKVSKVTLPKWFV